MDCSSIGRAEPLKLFNWQAVVKIGSGLVANDWDSWLSKLTPDVI
ncbi:hypothetical protein [Halomicronema sp. CCY15110]|nr:hypothetical protein [Halomicronema sp. CCY15110]